MARCGAAALPVGSGQELPVFGGSVGGGSVPVLDLLQTFLPEGPDVLP